MHLQGRLRGQKHAGAAADRHMLSQTISRKDAGAGTHENDVRRAVEIERPADTQGRLGVGPRHDRPAGAILERQLEPRMAAHNVCGTDVDR
jgi:hypothetical protein